MTVLRSVPPMRQLRVAVITSAILLIAVTASAQLVTRVIDGDTLVVQGVGTVRLIGVDTPEAVDPRRPVQQFGREASAFLRAQATGQTVRLEFDGNRTDRYGRTLAYVYLVDGTFLNAEIVRQGYGHAYTAFPFRHLEQFRAYEQEARDGHRGLWAGGTQPQTVIAEQPPCVNINTADGATLARIIHIEQERAEKIIGLRATRAFKSVDDLTRVNGIGNARLRDIRAQGVACVP